MTRTRTGLTVGMLLATLLLTGCEDTTGGGQIPSAADPDSKATFGFSFHCQDTFDEAGDVLALLSGNFQYRDHGYLIADQRGKERSLSIHGELNAGVFFATCDVLDQASLDVFGSEGYVGEFYFQPRHVGEPGVFHLLFTDNGRTGPSTGDEITIRLYEDAGQILGGTPIYENSGVVTRGQVTQHFD